MIKHLGKKVHIWPRKRHDSTSNMSSNDTGLDNDEQENFRSRSKSLDVNGKPKILGDCDATYKMFDKIVKEGILF